MLNWVTGHAYKPPPAETIVDFSGDECPPSEKRRQSKDSKERNRERGKSEKETEIKSTVSGSSSHSSIRGTGDEMSIEEKEWGRKERAERNSPLRPSNTRIDAPSAITQSTTALDKVRGLFDSHSFKFREFVLNAKVPDDKGVSTASSTGLEVDPAITLSVVVEELVGYLELYPKLRFQYDELKTKENYIKDLLGIEDLQVDLHDSNYNFEPEKEYLKQCKEELGVLKAEMRSLLQEIESVAERVAKGWTENEQNIAVLEKLPEELKELDEAIREEIKMVEGGDSGQGGGEGASDELMHLPLKEMETLIRNLEMETTTLDSEVSHLDSEILRRQRMMDKLDKELGPLEADREELVGRAEQEKEKREMERESGQDRNLHGRWNKAVLEAMGQFLPR